MPQPQTARYSPDLDDAPDDLRDFLTALAAEGIAATQPNAGPGDPILDPLRLQTTLSDAVIEEREYIDTPASEDNTSTVLMTGRGSC
ncbi:MAG TPA: hypothetical protein VF665_04810 [Longimicrobium sp.]|jgi:hypothetical protein|uniref:hypothetical protein n=1 Tax=Longimicrobium sp. TaxID=2029185 RepID=UPI002ED7BE1B